MSIMDRMREIDTFLSDCDPLLLEWAVTLNEEQILDALQRFEKEKEIASRLNKDLEKYIRNTDMIRVLIERKALISTIKTLKVEGSKGSVEHDGGFTLT